MTARYTVQSIRFTSSRSRESLIEIVCVSPENTPTRFLRVAIEANVQAIVEVWSPRDLRWNEMHAFPPPMVTDVIDSHRDELIRIASTILEN